MAGWCNNCYAQSPRDLFPQDMYHQLQFIGLTKLTSLERRKMPTCPHDVHYQPEEWNRKILAQHLVQWQHSPEVSSPQILWQIERILASSNEREVCRRAKEALKTLHFQTSAATGTPSAWMVDLPDWGCSKVDPIAADWRSYSSLPFHYLGWLSVNGRELVYRCSWYWSTSLAT